MRLNVTIGLCVFILGLNFDCVSQERSFSIPIPKGVKVELHAHQRAKIWADSVFSTLNIEERIGQLLMMAAYSNKGKDHRQQVERWVTETKIGGLIWMQGSPSKQLEFSQSLQAQAKVPLLYAMDAEWGLSMRLDSTIKYPRQMTLGAIQNRQLIYEFGKRMAYECRRMGIHVSFSPVLDINNNPKNPVIGTRSFGSDPNLVIQCGVAYMRGLQEHGVLATGKHFPGHGDTETDSHTGLPVIPYSRSRLDSLELKPFKALVENGIGSLMIAHLNLPKLDATPYLPSTLSRTIVTGILRDEWNYSGLLFTDALNMSGVRAHFKPGEIEVMALKAGNDVLLFSENPNQAIEHIKKALQQGALIQEEIDAHCKRILEAKYKYCIVASQTESSDLDSDLNAYEAKDLNSTLYENAITLLKAESGILPLGIHEHKKILCLTIGAEAGSVFFKKWKKYSNAKEYSFTVDSWLKNSAKFKKQINAFDQVIIQIAKPIPANSRNTFWKSICNVSTLKPTCAVVFATPYTLQCLSLSNPLKALVMSYEYTPEAQIATADALMGGFSIQGKLPVTAGAYTLYSGIDWSPKSMQNPINSSSKAERIKLRIDSIAQSGIERHAYPGCQVAIFQNGIPVYLKAYGHLTYDFKSPEVSMHTIFDLASLTKVLSTAIALMRLNSQHQFDYHKPVMAYLPQYNEKGHLKIEDILTHQAGLKPWIPFYKRFLDSGVTLKPGYCSSIASGLYTCTVAEDLYTTKSIHDSIMRIIEASPLGPKKYLYSDLGYYYMQEIIEGISKKPLDVFVSEIYTQMGLGLTYNPLLKYKRQNIAPTESDDVFRKQLIHGYVHDPGAAIHGGVAGHAGLFGNATDVAKLMNMIMQLGRYENAYLLDSNVVKTFTRKAYFNGNRRALCFDKPEPNAKKKSPVTDRCSLESFGHSGFTGTFAWADPKSNLVFVFLSNRVYPDAENPLLVRLKIRQRIHEQAYALIQAK